MYNSYALLKFKKILDSIQIDIDYRLELEEPEIKDEYFKKQFTDGYETEEVLIGEDGVANIHTIMKRDLIWGFDYNGSLDNSFFRKYYSLEKDLFDEMDLNRKTVKDFDEIDSLYEDLLNWINDKVNGIQYNQEKDIFDCDFVRYGDNFTKITFKKAYEKDIQNFYKELKNRLMQTYSMVLDKIPSPIYKPNLRWEGKDNELIELITALLVNKSIAIKTGITTRKEVIRQFEQIFEIKLKDPESKLSRATERLDGDSKILNSLQIAYKNYVKGKLEK